MSALPSEPPQFFPRGPSPAARLTLLGIVSLVLMFADIRFRYLDNIRHVAGAILAPVQRVAAMPGEFAEWVSGYFRLQSELLGENTELRAKLLAQAQAVQGLARAREENRKLRELLKVEARLTGPAVPAQVLYTGRDPFSQKYVIDRGERDGLRPGQAVIDETGVLGQVTRVYPMLAEVTLLTDKDHTVPVQVERSGVRTVLQGSGVSRMPELRFLPPNADIQNGDRLVTSGIDGVYPPGLAVAEVVGVERDPGRVFARVRCRPLAGFDRSAQVLVLGLAAPPPARPEEPAEIEARRPGAKGRRGG